MTLLGAAAEADPLRIKTPAGHNPSPPKSRAVGSFTDVYFNYLFSGYGFDIVADQIADSGLDAVNQFLDLVDNFGRISNTCYRSLGLDTDNNCTAFSVSKSDNVLVDSGAQFRLKLYGCTFFINHHMGSLLLPIFHSITGLN